MTDKPQTTDATVFVFDEQAGRLKSFLTKEATHSQEAGWINGVRLNMEVILSSAEEMAGVQEQDIVDAIHKQGRVVSSKKDGAHTYELKAKRKFPPVDMSLQDGKLKVSVIGKIKQYVAHCAEGALYITFSVDADVNNGDLNKLGRLLESQISVTTVACQTDLFDSEQAA